MNARAQCFATGDTGFHEWIIQGEKRCIMKANYLVELFEQE